MLRIVIVKLRRLCSGLRCPFRRRRQAKPQVVVSQKFTPTKTSTEAPRDAIRRGSFRVDGEHLVVPETASPIRIATFNAAMFSMAAAVPGPEKSSPGLGSVANDRPKGILKQRKEVKPTRRVSINLPDNEISIERSKHSSASFRETATQRDDKDKDVNPNKYGSKRTVLDVLKEVGADVFALQNVRAEEEKGMRPLSELAEGLGMKYVFAESWAPEYGNAVLSKWPIKQWKVQKIFDDSDFRNVLKVTIDVPKAGELKVHCTHLDHLDENWRMKQIKAMMQHGDGEGGGYILAGGLNSLDETDYSADRWSDIVKYYEEIGKPTPKAEVMKFLKAKQYIDAQNFAGECEAVVVVAKGQDVQGTCKYGTRVDYIFASPSSSYKFVPGSYGVVSSKGISDHHIVKVDVVISNKGEENSRREKPRQTVINIDKNSFKGIWRVNS